MNNLQSNDSEGEHETESLWYVHTVPGILLIVLLVVSMQAILVNC